MDSEIQIITYPPINDKYGDKIKISFFDSHDSVDSYKYNIIDLNNSKIWGYDELYDFLDNDNIQTLKKGIDNNNQKSYFIIILPKNLRFQKYFDNRKQGESWTKNETNIIQQFIEHYFNLYHIKLVYGNNTTKIQNYNINAGFYMQTDYENYEILTKNNNEKITSIKQENIILTTLQLTNRMEILTFINQTLLEKETEIPEWFDEIKMFDDVEQIIAIDAEKEKIKNSKIKIKESEEILEKNNHFKSILYTNSDELVNVVFEILEEILGCNLSDFNDEKKEDFLIKFENNHVIIGEIKGVTSNVRFEHVGQAEQHYRRYLDNNPEYINETIKQVLIINYERKKKPSERHEIHEDQIKLAERNGCLIIDTCTLLKIYEFYLSENIETKLLKEYIFNKSGLFDIKEIL